MSTAGFAMPLAVVLFACLSFGVGFQVRRFRVLAVPIVLSLGWAGVVLSVMVEVASSYDNAVPAGMLLSIFAPLVVLGIPMLAGVLVGKFWGLHPDDKAAAAVV